MLRYSEEYLGGWHSSPMTMPTGADKNMALESFLLHFRNLRAFLCPSLQPVSNFDDDVLASDFLNEPAGRDLADAVKLGADQARLNKMLAHLSYSREQYIEAGDNSWNTRAMLTAMLSELQRFLATLPGDRSAWFPEL